MPGLHRSSSGTSDSDSASSSSAEVFESATSNESRGRRKARDPRQRIRSPDADNHSKAATIKSGYHTFTAFGKDFCIEKRWKYLRELGSGAYGNVISVQDEITGEILAVKMITRVLDKTQLSKRALREITLLRHFNNHENIIGLIDMDVSGPNFNEIYLFMEPMEADLYQIIRSGQPLTNAHYQFFMFQLLRGLKYIHASDVIHRDLKPGNLLVNSDCELKICDMGLSRGYNAKAREDEPFNMTEYVMTRWYRAPEIMLSFKRYDKAIDMWSVGCIFAELLGGKPIFKGKDYVDQLNLILQVLGTPSEETMDRIGSPKAKAYIRSFDAKEATPWETIFPDANDEALDLLSKLLTFNPQDRLTCEEALQHPWLAPFHNLEELIDPPPIFNKWQFVEELDTTEQFREALYKEVMEFRDEVRSIGQEASPNASEYEDALDGSNHDTTTPQAADTLPTPPPSSSPNAAMGPIPFPTSEADDEGEEDVPGEIPAPSAISRFSKDPYRTYSTIRRTSMFSLADRSAPPTVLPEDDVVEVPFGYRSRIQSSDTLGGGGAPPRFIRQLSTVSLSGVADAHRANGIVAAAGDPAKSLRPVADAPASELPSEWGRKSAGSLGSGST